MKGRCTVAEMGTDPAWHEREAARIIGEWPVSAADLDRARIHAEIAKSLRQRDMNERLERIARAIRPPGRGGFG
jgi:hypothetical protein